MTMKSKTERVNDHRIAMIANDIGIDRGSLTSLMLDMFDWARRPGGYRMWLQRAYESNGELCVEGRLHMLTPDDWDALPEGQTSVINYDDAEAEH
jgi:hypothetical protein